MKNWKLALSCSLGLLGVGLAQSDVRAGQRARLLRPQAAVNAEPGGSAMLSHLALHSDRILIGRVAAVDSRPQGPGGELGIHSEIELEVERTLRGASESRVRFWVHGGRWNDRVRRVSGQASFDVGESIAVFLRARPDGALFPTAMGLGKWQADLAANTIRHSGLSRSVEEVEAVLGRTP